MGDGTVQLQAFQPDCGEAAVHTLPDLVAFHIKVLRAEGDIVAEPLEHGLRVRVLQYQAHASSRFAYGNVIHQHAPFGRAAFGVDHGYRAVFRGFCALNVFAGSEQSRPAFKNGGFADAGRAQQQHALPGFDVEVEPAHAEMFARRVAIPPMFETQCGVLERCAGGCC